MIGKQESTERLVFYGALVVTMLVHYANPSFHRPQRFWLALLSKRRAAVLALYSPLIVVQT